MRHADGAMGLVHAELKLGNPKSGALALEVRALVDTGALHLCIPESMSRRLGLSAERARRVTFADGRTIEAPYAGPIRVEFAGRSCFVGAMVFGEEVLLGAIPMEDLDLIVDPARREVIPRDPRGPATLAKALARA